MAVNASKKSVKNLIYAAGDIGRVTDASNQMGLNALIAGQDPVAFATRFTAERHRYGFSSAAIQAVILDGIKALDRSMAVLRSSN